MHLVDADGQLRQVLSAWVSDGDRWLSAEAAWLDVDGTPMPDSELGLKVTVTAVALNHLEMRVSWLVSAADRVDVYVGSELVHTAATLSGSVSVPDRVPGSSYEAHVVVTRGGVPFTSERVPVTMPGMPAPGTPVVDTITGSSLSLSWGSVLGATSYDILDGNSGAVLGSSAVPSWVRTGLSSGTAYSTSVRARYDAQVASPASPAVVATTSASFAAGTYTFRATSCDTYQTNPASWRGTAGKEVWHGDGNPWSSRGVNTACFYGYREVTTGKTLTEFFAGLPANVLKIEAYAIRSSTTHGLASAQLCRFQPHSNASRPTGAPTLVGTSHNSGTLNRGEAKWVTLPVAWAADLIAGRTKGMTWGGTPRTTDGARYMVGPTTGANAAMMSLRITVA